MADQLSALEQALAARNAQLDASIGRWGREGQEQQQEPADQQGNITLERVVADALQHLLKEADADEADWPPTAPVGPTAPLANVPASSGGRAADGDGDDDDEALPPQAAARIYKARVKALYTDLSTLQAEAKEKAAQLGAAEKELCALQAEKAAWLKQQKALEGQVERLLAAGKEAKEALAEKENALRELGKDRQAALQERRQASNEGRAREARLRHALGELEHYKKLLEQARAGQQRSAGGEVSKDDYARVVADNKRLEAQRQGLAQAFKKAMKLVDVLRRQKLHLEAASVLSISSSELMKAMELGAAGPLAKQ